MWQLSSSREGLTLCIAPGGSTKLAGGSLGKQMEVPSQEEPSNPESGSSWSQMHCEAVSFLPGLPLQAAT